LTLFSGALFNTPETLLESDTTKSGRVEYQYTVAGGISVLFIGIELKVGNNRERLEYFGQAIAECIGMIAKSY
jgi:ABC-type sugar transport system substrate-binding protein